LSSAALAADVAALASELRSVLSTVAIAAVYPR
jgi:hypothetical protein